ncbi:hypothetical protein [Priestia sp. J2]|uniref:hypothetical protein n=1 Tax=Priestia sp. J2 TaxID=2886505 RepID=UPI001E65335F|nr:hypothetical protein [Priestia sp. J2]
MESDDKLLKEKRIKKEERNLKKLFKDAPTDKKTLINGLIQRAAFMRVTLEDYEADIDENGYVELFSQSEKTEPYERERPVVRLYNTMNGNYQKIIKQLSDLLPKDNENDKNKSSALMEFLSR